MQWNKFSVKVQWICIVSNNLLTPLNFKSPSELGQIILSVCVKHCSKFLLPLDWLTDLVYFTWSFWSQLSFLLSHIVPWSFDNKHLWPVYQSTFISFVELQCDCNTHIDPWICMCHIDSIHLTKFREFQWIYDGEIAWHI